MPVKKLFAWYSPDHLFLDQRHIVFENVSTWPIAEEILTYSPVFGVPVDAQFSENLKIVIKSATEISKILLNMPLPCFSYRAVQNMLRRGPGLDFFFREWFVERSESIKGPKVTVPISGDAIIGVWCLLAASAEVIEKQKDLISGLKKQPSPVIKALSDTIEARMHGIILDKALQSLSNFNVPQTALEFVKRWITGQVSFVRAPKRKGKGVEEET
jgi:hypothetical protein